MISTGTDKRDYMGLNDLIANQSSIRVRWRANPVNSSMLEANVWFANMFELTNYILDKKSKIMKNECGSDKSMILFSSLNHFRGYFYKVCPSVGQSVRKKLFTTTSGTSVIYLKNIVHIPKAKEDHPYLNHHYHHHHLRILHHQYLTTLGRIIVPTGTHYIKLVSHRLPFNQTLSRICTAC